jgi:hypothetical protein
MNAASRPEAAHGNAANQHTGSWATEPEPRLANAKRRVLPKVEDDRRRHALEPRCRWRAYAKRWAGVVR